MNFGRMRTIVAAVVFIGISLCIIAGVATGTLCGFGWSSIAALCPLGAVLSMVSAHSIIPQALICIVIAAVFVFVLGRAFCSWICPVSLWTKIKRFFKPVHKRQAEDDEKLARVQDIAKFEIAAAKGHSCESCGACKQHHAKLDSRHAVLGGSILASAVFGFPVFCLICPVGLSFATISILVGLFGHGDLNWSLAFVPFMLIVELVVLRKWCSRFCPLAALINLVGRFSKTARPEIDNSKCIEASRGVACSRCAAVCKYDVNLRHPEYGELPLHDCSRCMECVDACPADAISIRLLSKPASKSAAEKASIKQK